MKMENSAGWYNELTFGRAWQVTQKWMGKKPRRAQFNFFQSFSIIADLPVKIIHFRCISKKDAMLFLDK